MLSGRGRGRRVSVDPPGRTHFCSVLFWFLGLLELNSAQPSPLAPFLTLENLKMQLKLKHTFPNSKANLSLCVPAQGEHRRQEAGIQCLGASKGPRLTSVLISPLLCPRKLQIPGLERTEAYTGIPTL
jgi:hypothetical protein